MTADEPKEMPGPEGIPAAASAELPEGAEEPQQSEERPVIDVHAPHGSVHTWKDFWIHLGTIALGLLIALGLEQSVEYFHHLHQRHQLEEDLHAEARTDHEVAIGDLRRFVVMRSWILAMRAAVDRTRDSGGKLKPAYIQQPLVDPQTGARLPMRLIPSDAVWVTAKESDLAGLLPREEAEVYSRHDVSHELLVDSMKAYYDRQNGLKAFEIRFEQSGGTDDVPELARMTVADLQGYSALLSEEIEAIDYMTYRLNFYDAETQGLLNGAKTEKEMLQQVTQRGLEQN